MNEIQRLAYLDAIGIDAYISRSQLPAAAPSRRLRIVRPAEPAPVAVSDPAPLELPQAARGGTQKQGARPVRAAQEMLAAASPARTVSKPDRVRPGTGAATPGVNAESTPMFSVSASFLAGYCWLDEIPRARELGENYRQLLQGVCFALGWDLGPVLVERFDWPMHHNRQLDQGQETARHGFEGFIRARMEQYPVRGVILLGEPEGGWLDPAVFSGVEILSTVSAWRMLKQPELKKEAWRDLKRLSKAQT